MTTLKGYKEELKLFSTYVQKPIALVTTADIRTYLGLNPNLKKGTISKKLSVIKAFFTWLVLEELSCISRFRIRPLKQEPRLPKALTPLEMEDVRNCCKTLRERAFVELFFSTGCRIAEVSGMKKADIDWNSGALSVIGKGNKERIVYLSPTAIFHLKAYLSLCEYEENDSVYIFSTSRRPYRQLTPTAIRKRYSMLTIDVTSLKN